MKPLGVLIACSILACVVSLGALASQSAEQPATEPGERAGQTGPTVLPEAQDGVRFVTVDVFIDSGETPLAAYQIDLWATSAGGRVLLAGIEGGEHQAFREPAHYDPRALHAEEAFDHVVLAAFSTGKDLPSGRTRVATLHYQAPNGGDVTLQVESVIAGDRDARPVEAIAQATLRRLADAQRADTPNTEQGDGQ